MKPIKLLNHSSTLKRWCYRLLWAVRRRPTSLVWQTLDSLGRNATFLNIGANDGLSGSPVAEFVMTRGWRGIMVEPVPHVFHRLCQNYKNLPVQLVNLAVGNEVGIKPFYFLRKNNELPPGYDQIGSLDKDTLLSNSHLFPGLEKHLTSHLMFCTTLKHLLTSINQHQFDAIIIDAEGQDAEIVLQINFERPPKVIIFEHHHLSSASEKAARYLLAAQGYTLRRELGDTIAVRT